MTIELESFIWIFTTVEYSIKLPLKCIQHACLRNMVTELGHHELAIKIKDSAHAGIATNLSKSIANDETIWEMENKQCACHE